MTESKTNQERLREITDGIEQGIKELFDSDRFRKYLSVMSRFHRYSVNNTMLIYLQKPDATLVAGFQKWKKQFGRHVKQGERGITIIAPTPFKKKIEEAKLDPDTQAPLLDKDGNQIMEEREISIPVFKPVKVFDVSQTDGKKLPHLASQLDGSVEQYEIFVEALRRAAPVPITFKPLEPSMDGYFSATEQAIAIRDGMSQVQTISAMVHEIAHSKLHNYEKQQAEAEAVQPQKDRHTEEVEAESISYAVCQYYGIETGENSFGYIATWSKGKELKELRASLETINKTASGLITDIDRSFEEICKERGIDPKALPETTQEQAEAAPTPAETAPVEQDKPELPDTTLDEYPMPDGGKTMDALKDLDYMGDDLLPVGKESATVLWANGFTVYHMIGCGGASMCMDDEDIDEQPDDALFAVAREEWEESGMFREAIAERMNHQEEREAAFLNHAADCFAIYQVKDAPEYAMIRFESLDRLDRQPERKDYAIVYTAPLPEGANLETLFEQFNLNHPADYQRPSMSVSDIVAIKRDGKVSYHYCDSVGFAELSGFNQPENYLKNAELATEDDANMIDGIINNGPKQPTVAELEAQVKAGQTISLTDLANAIHAEKKAKPKAKEQKPSILTRLKQPLPKQTNKKAPQRSAEQEIC